MPPTPPLPAVADTAELERILSGALIRLRMHSPFFAALALFARTEIREEIPTAATDGRNIYWNPRFLQSLTPREVLGVLLHEVLHAALLHTVRRGIRDPLLWNIAADIVVNGMIDAEVNRPGGGPHGMPSSSSPFALPSGAVRDPALASFSVEEVYELIQKDPKKRELADAWRDLLEGWGGAADLEGRRAELEAHWRTAHAQAATLLRGAGRGSLPAELLRELSMLEASRLDWRSHLWRFLVRTPVDFCHFDRRFFGRGLYLETLDGESVRVHVAIDTSGSIDDKILAQFLGEVQGILRTYPHILCDLYYVDARAYGPYRLTADIDASAFPRPQGGGGTDFCPFFEAVREASQSDDTGFGSTGDAICVYLTDGFGSFPDPAPDYHTLWVVTAGGLDLEKFPFGETVRLV